MELWLVERIRHHDAKDDANGKVLSRPPLHLQQTRKIHILLEEESSVKESNFVSMQISDFVCRRRGEMGFPIQCDLGWTSKG